MQQGKLVVEVCARSVQSGSVGVADGNADIFVVPVVVMLKCGGVFFRHEDNCPCRRIFLVYPHGDTRFGSQAGARRHTDYILSHRTRHGVRVFPKENIARYLVPINAVAVGVGFEGILRLRHAGDTRFGFRRKFDAAVSPALFAEILGIIFAVFHRQFNARRSFIYLDSNFFFPDFGIRFLGREGKCHRSVDVIGKFEGMFDDVGVFGHRDFLEILDSGCSQRAAVGSRGHRHGDNDRPGGPVAEDVFLVVFRPGGDRNRDLNGVLQVVKSFVTERGFHRHSRTRHQTDTDVPYRLTRKLEGRYRGGVFLACRRPGLSVVEGVFRPDTGSARSEFLSVLRHVKIEAHALVFGKRSSRSGCSELIPLLHKPRRDGDFEIAGGVYHGSDVMYPVIFRFVLHYGEIYLVFRQYKFIEAVIEVGNLLRLRIPLL